MWDTKFNQWLPWLAVTMILGFFITSCGRSDFANNSDESPASTNNDTNNESSENTRNEIGDIKACNGDHRWDNTFLGKVDIAWSPMGNLLAIRDNDPNLAFYNFTTGTFERTDIESGFVLTWSPDASKLAFIKRDLHSIYIYDIITDHVDEIESFALDLSWSLDGSQLYFIGNPAPDPEASRNLFVQHVDNLDSPPLLLSSEAINAVPIAWSADQVSFVYSKVYTGGFTHLFEIAPNTVDSHQVTDLIRSCNQRPVSSVGNLIAFESDADNKDAPPDFDIWTLDLSTGIVIQWTEDRADEMEPVWSPDNSQIVYRLVREASDEELAKLTPPLEEGEVYNSDLWLLDINTGEKIQLTNTPSIYELHPQWSPDGQKIAFVSRENRQWHIDMINVTTHERQRLVTLGK